MCQDVELAAGVAGSFAGLRGCERASRKQAPSQPDGALDLARRRGFHGRVPVLRMPLPSHLVCRQKMVVPWWWWCRGGGGAFGSCQINQVPAGDRIKANRLCWGADIRWRDDSYVSGCEKRRGSDRDSNAFSSGARAPPVTVNVDVNIDPGLQSITVPDTTISLSNGSAMVTVALPRRASVSDRPRQRCAEAGGNMCGPGSYGDSSLTLSRIGSGLLVL